MRRLLAPALASLALIGGLAGAPLRADELTLARLFSSPRLGGSTPQRLRVSPDGTRATFLRGKSENKDQLDLWEYNVAARETRLLVDSQVLAPQGEQLSDVEKARRERQRIASFSGIVDYDFSEDGGKILFPLNGELYLYDLAKSGRDALRQLTHGGGYATDARVSPRGAYVSFVRERNLWVIDLATGQEIQLTRDAGETVANATAEFVADEEMDRHTGYWWAPDDSALAFTRTDESKVPIQKRFEIYAERTEVVEERYPAAGDPNVLIQLGVVAPVAGATAHWIDLGPNADIYLARVSWLPDGKRLAYQRQTRDQRTLDLVLVDVVSGAQRNLLTETSPTWVNLNDDLRFLKQQAAFLWASERSGLKQLYLYGLDGKLIRQLTATPWPLDRLLALDEKRGRVYVAASGPDPTEGNVYAFALSGRGEPQRLTPPASSNVAEFFRDARVFIDYHSDLSTPRSVALYDADGKRLVTLDANELKPGHPYWPYADGHRTAEIGHLTGAAGQVLYYRLLKPGGFDPAKRYPVIVSVYGGPGIQTVGRSWGVSFDQYLARRGFVVFQLDNRGSAGRGKAFEDPIHRNMGVVEVIDQLEGVRWLKSQAWVDPTRIGVYGGSYGGYMTIMLLAKASDQFACGVALAPVTDWKLYDTHYTERYLERPSENPKGYEQSSVFPWLDGLKSPLLLIHGMADDNVLFINSTRLMSELQKRGTQSELMTYPGSKHGISGQANQTHAYTKVYEFLERHLKPSL